MFARFFSARPRPASKKPTRRLCRFEPLEDRKLMAAVTANLSNGLLDIRGTAGNDTVIVRQIGNVVSIDGVRIQGSGSINSIRVQGFGGNDALRLDGNGAAGQSVKVASVIFGGDGNDLLVGGERSDQLQGGNGNDTLYGMAANDLLFGQAGNDLIYGGAGNDELQGGTGYDELLGETGNDILFGQEDSDWLFGGSGNDYLDGGSGLDVGYGGTGADSFKNLNDTAFFLVNPHLKSPRRGVGDLASTGIQDFSSFESDRKV